MNIDLTNLIINLQTKMSVDIKVTTSIENLSSSDIKRLEDTTFKGEITKLYDDDYQLKGVLSGTMILSDAITLEDCPYKFSIDVEEDFSQNAKNLDNNLEINHNMLDVGEFLWQLILLEVPLKVVNPKNENLTKEGNGWRLTTEEEIKKEHNSPFEELKNKFN